MDPRVVKIRMRQYGVIGAVIGIGLFTAAYLSWGNLFHVIFIPIAAGIGYMTPWLIAGTDEYD